MGDATTDSSRRVRAEAADPVRAAEAGAPRGDRANGSSSCVVIPFPDNLFQRLLRLAEAIEKDVAGRFPARRRFRVSRQTGRSPRIWITATCFIDTGPQGGAFRCFAGPAGARKLLLETDDPDWMTDLAALCLCAAGERGRGEQAR